MLKGNLNVFASLKYIIRCALKYIIGCGEQLYIDDKIWI